MSNTLLYQVQASRTVLSIFIRYTV